MVPALSEDVFMLFITLSQISYKYENLGHNLVELFRNKASWAQFHQGMGKIRVYLYGYVLFPGNTLDDFCQLTAAYPTSSILR
jgi:hypothetical protein